MFLIVKAQNDYVIDSKLTLEKTEGQSKMDNPEKLAT